MKRLILLLAVAVFAVGCSKDDDEPSVKKVPVTITLASDTDANMNFDVNITYDSKRRISKIVRTGANPGTFTLHYADNKKVAAIDYSVMTSGQVILTYDSQGRVSSLTDQGTVPIIYFDNGDFSFSGTTFSKNNAGDIDMFADSTILFADSKKGAFVNVAAYDSFIYLIMDFNAIYYAARRPLSEITNENDYTVSCDNTFDEQDYITNSTVTGNANFTVAYEYEEM